MTSLGILGPIEAWSGEHRLEVGGRRQVALLAFLIVHANRAVSSDAVIDAVWGSGRSGADNRLPMAVARLRRGLAPLSGNAELGLRTVGGGYLLAVGPDELDADVFGAQVERGRRALDAGEPGRAAELLAGALAMWRGPPLAEVAFEDFAQGEIRRLEESRLVTLEARMEADLQLGHHARLVGELEGLLSAQPTRETLAGQLMLALYRCGRQADALGVYQRTRTRLLEDLGLVPGPALRTLQADILEQAPSLALDVPPAVARDVSALPAPPPVVSTATSPREHRKTVTVLFVDVVGSTELGARLDPEALRVLMRRYYDVVRMAVERHGGSVQKFIGDAVVAVFGVPAAHEDDALRAVRAAMAAQDRLAELNRELETGPGIQIEIRSGINTGEVVVGDHAGGEEIVVGDPLNVAARLEQSAGAGEILLGASTYAVVRHAVRAERLEPLEVKGKAQPVIAHRVIEMSDDVRAYQRRHRVRLVGRTHELRLFEEAYGRVAHETSCHLFTVLGPAGVGKSRLVEEAAARCDGAVVLTGRCLPYGEGITYWPLGEILRTAARIAETDSTEEAHAKLAALVADEDVAGTIAAILAGLIGAGDAVARPEESAWAVRRLFETIARRSPLIVVFEDIHWAEPTLLDLVDHLAEMTRDAPLLIVCVARPELLDARNTWAGGTPNAATIHLQPLGVEESAELIDRLAPAAALPAELSARIAAGSDGFPLFVEEMIAMLLDDGSPTGDRAGLAASDPASMEIPPTITALLAARLDGLPDDERHMLELASIVGREFWQDAIEALGPPELIEISRSILRSLVRKDLVVPENSTLTGDDSFRFRHILIRDAAHASLPKSERADLHERFASWLERSMAHRLTEIEEIIGYHLEEAHTLRTSLGLAPGDLAERGAGHLGAAGSRAAGRDELRTAVSLFERARSLLAPGASTHRRLGVDLGAALAFLGEHERAREVYEEVRAAAIAAGDELALAHAQLELAALRVDFDPEGATADTRLAAEKAKPIFERAGDHYGLARALFSAGISNMMMARHGPWMRTCEQALEHFKSADNSFGVGWMYWQISASMTAGPVPIPEALTRLQAILRAAPPTLGLQAGISIMRGFLLALRGCDEEALEAKDQAWAWIRELGRETSYNTGYAFYAGPLLRVLGRLDEAERLLRDAEELYERVGNRAVRSTLLADLAQVLAERGRLAEARQTALLAVETGSSDDYWTLALAHGTIAKVLAGQGEPGAERAARHAVELAERTDMLWLQGEQWECLGEVLLADQRRDEARQAYRTALQRFERKGATALADRVRARLAPEELTSRR